MTQRAEAARDRIKVALVLALALIVVACRPQLIVRLSTTVYHDGGLSRILEIEGRTAEGEEPTASDWLASRAGVLLASPEAWDRVERESGRLRAEGFFLEAGLLPDLLAFEIDDAPKRANIDTTLAIENRGIIKRWVYTETHGDPFGSEESARALDALTELAVHALREELRRHFGEDLDTAAAESVLRDDGRALAADLIDANRAAPGWERSAPRIRRWSETLRRAGLPVTPEADAETGEFWDAQTPLILAWTRDRIAAALSSEEQPIQPDELSFWPLGDDFETQFGEIAERVWGGEDELAEEVLPHLAAITGYYGADTAPRFRFETRLRLPGSLLRTNGTPAGDSVVWVFREQDLNYAKVVLRAESVELQTEPLTALGARRELEPAALLRLADLLWKQDPDGLLEQPLREAIRLESLDPLRGEDLEPVELQPVAQEIADLLDPEVPLEIVP